MIGKSLNQQQLELFKPLLSDFLDMRHELVLLSDHFDWKYFDKEFSTLYSNTGQTAMPTRLKVADDSAVNLTIMQDILSEAGYVILTVQNRKIAVKQAADYLPDLILMDWQMPVLNGIEALEILKKDPKTNEIPVIMVIGIATTAEHLQEAYQKDAIDFIKKPFEKIELLARVKAKLSFVTYYKLVIFNKNNELSASLLQLSQLTELHEQISKKLTRLKDDFPELESHINEITGIVSVRLLNEAWKRYEENFMELNPSFYKLFIEVNPDISPPEIRLCTLLRLNMSSKETTAFIHQEEASIRVSRSRLRRRLGLGELDNLVGYLLKF